VVVVVGTVALKVVAVMAGEEVRSRTAATSEAVVTLTMRTRTAPPSTERVVDGDTGVVVDVAHAVVEVDAVVDEVIAGSCGTSTRVTWAVIRVATFVRVHILLLLLPRQSTLTLPLPTTLAWAVIVDTLTLTPVSRRRTEEEEERTVQVWACTQVLDPRCSTTVVVAVVRIRHHNMHLRVAIRTITTAVTL
jgi:hypothetical protein